MCTKSMRRPFDLFSMQPLVVVDFEMQCTAVVMSCHRLHTSVRLRKTLLSHGTFSASYLITLRQDGLVSSSWVE